MKETHLQKDLSSSLENSTILGHRQIIYNNSFISSGTRSNIYLIDPYITHKSLWRSLLFIYTIIKNNGHILFITSEYKYPKLIASCAKRLGQSSCTTRWIGGTLTNWKEISTNNTLKLNKSLKGFIGLYPDICIVLDPENNQSAIKEANKVGIPVLAFIDTDTFVYGIDYTIYLNDDSTKSFYNIFKYIVQIIEFAKKTIK